MMKTLDAVAICNALMDILAQTSDTELAALGLTKGNMHLVDSQRQDFILQKLRGLQQAEEIGGSGLNVIRALAQLGMKTAFAGMVGCDIYGTKIMQRMAELGICAKIMKCDHAATGTCAILVTQDGERTMNTNLGASRLFDETLVPYDEIAQAKIFHFAGYQWDTEGQKKAIYAAIQAAKSHHTMVSFDIADPFVVGRNEDAFRKIIQEDASIVFANEQEARLLYHGSPEEAADQITRGKAIGVIKLGAKGALIAHGRERITVDAVPTKVIDTTAAGDMFAAGFLYGLCQGRDLRECGRIATMLASDVISRYGAQLSPALLESIRLESPGIGH